ncbi:hypothetical protein G4B88_023163 [Cannabis sativa]|uniref:Major facilitator superfamily (MFS) profile domain-containing protein n=1 Tax=Cannabis sativa TaxID=3483 RepID=A0A7J6EGX8_CANSA|nr:hypothetical protein G4B88_023163 [Cannabis sativa]
MDSEESNREVLLVVKKEEEEEENRGYYDEKCPGCIVDNMKKSNSTIPFKHLFFVFLLALAAVRFSYAFWHIRDFGIAKKEEDIGYYAGFLGCAFLLGRGLTSILWGITADRYGRKPVMLCGIIAVVIFNTFFGLSINYWMALSTRFLLGSMCGILGSMMLSTAWGIGLVIGPALGGFLAQPAEKFPEIFSKESIFGRFPYFLPSLFISVFALVVTFLGQWLPETLHFHTKNDEEKENYDGPKEDLLEEDEKKSKQSLLKNWPLMSSIMLYCVFQLHDMAYVEIFPLWAVSPKKYGGLSYSSDDIGEILALAGFVMLVFQLFLYPPIERIFGPVHLARIGAVITIALLSSYPFIAKLSGLTLTLLVDLAVVLKNLISICITTGLFLLQNKAVGQSQRGAANGMSMAAMSLFKAAGPAGGGAIFAWVQNHQNALFLPGDHMVFFILNVIEFIALIMTFKPFLALTNNDENREVPLLRNEEEERCPGFVVEKLKQSNSSIPFKYFFFVFLLALAAALPISSLFPFLYFMIRDFGIAKKDEDIGYYVGAVGCAFMFGRFLTSIFWGMIADRYGRKPVLIFGTISVVIFNTLFGLSTNFWMAISTRFLLGSLCGILGPMRPAEKFPKLFSKESVFGRFPYFLPCLVISTFALGVTILCYWLPETLHFHNKNDEEKERSNIGSSCDPNKENYNLEKCPQKQSLHKNWPLMSSIMVYCVFQLHNMAYLEIFPLWAVSPKKYGGLSYSSEQVGEVLAISGLAMLVFQLFLYTSIERSFGPVHLARIGAVITIVVLSSFPFIAKLSGLTLTLLVDLAAMLKNVTSVCISTGLFLLQNRAVGQSQRGVANGVSMAAMSLFNAIGPAGGGVIFSWAQNHQNRSFLPGDHLVFFILNVVEFIAFTMTFKPFLNREVALLRNEEEEEEERCPGCVLEKFKQSNSSIPFNYFFFVFLLALAAALPISSLFPFLYFMIRDFGIAKKDEDIGYYAGAVGCAFMFGRFLTSIFWGMIADRYGRKPVLIFGTISVVIFNTLFGLSTNFWMAISTRFLLGSLCGILGPMRAYASEICRKEYQALGMSIISTAWGIGLVIGPALGGFLAQPAEKFPRIFSKESLFGRFPYFLPCLVISTFALVVTILCYWLPETLHFHRKKDEENLEEDNDMGKCNHPQKQSLYKNWPLMSSIMVYCVFQLQDMAYSEIFPLWAVSPKKYGGLSYSSEQVGEVLVISGFAMLVFQLFLYPSIERSFGPVHLARIGAVITIVVLSSYPFIAKLSGLTLTLLVDLAAMLKNVISVCITTGLFLLQNRVVSQSQRGAANGISMAAMSLFKAIGPAGGGVIFSWAQNHQNGSFLPGDHLVFFILNVVEFIAFAMTFKPFLVLTDVT